MLSLIYDPKDGARPSNEIMSRMRDSIVGSIKTSLVSGVFAERPDDLFISSDITSNAITITIKDAGERSEFSRIIPMEEFLGLEGTPDPSSGATDRQYPDNDSPFTPRVSLTPEVSISEFKNKTTLNSSKDQIVSTVKARLSEFVSEYLAVRSK